MANVTVEDSLIYNSERRSEVTRDMKSNVSFATVLGIGWVLEKFTADTPLGSYIFVTTITLCLPLFLIADYRGMSQVAAFRDEFERLLFDRDQVEVPADAFHVGLSSGRRLDEYSGDKSWDIGFLSISDRQSYHGDAARFAISRKQIKSVLIRRAPNTVMRPYVLIEYIDQDDRPRWMRIEIRDRVHRFEQMLRARMLRLKILSMPLNAEQGEIVLPDHGPKTQLLNVAAS